jgi:SAM-dependent methyltransferase
MILDKGKAVFTNYGVRLWKAILQKVYRFDKWHIVSIRQRKYARDIIAWCNRRPVRNSFLEIGCGLGDIVRSVRYEKRLGCDSDPKVLKAASFMASFRKRYTTEFAICVFPDTSFTGTYDIILLVNWVHHIEPEVLRLNLKEYFTTLLNPGGAIVIDTVHHPEYRWNHEITDLSKGIGEATVEKIGGYERGREVWAIVKDRTAGMRP